MVVEYLKSVWWLMLIKGIALIFLGIAALAWPGATVAIIVMILGLYFIIDGIVEFVMSIAAIGKHGTWIWTMIKSVLAIALGIWIFRYTGATIIFFVYMVGIWLIIRGFLDFIVFGAETFNSSTRTLAIIAGILSIVAGILLLFKPIAGTLALGWVFGIYAIITGPLMIATAISIKSTVDEIERR